MFNIKDYSVKIVTYDETKDFILNMHYAQRMPSISYSFGLFYNEELVGICTIGKPASPYLCKGVLGEEYSSRVFELNRLITIDNLKKNSLSFFLGKVLKILKSEDLIIVSYSDTGMDHHGYIYQATNWIYTGKTKGRTDKYTEGNKHSRHYSDENKHLRKVRTEKHRYVYFTKDKRLIEKLKYPILPYPKGDNKNYILGDRIKTTVINTETGEHFYI